MERVKPRKNEWKDTWAKLSIASKTSQQQSSIRSQGKETWRLIDDQIKVQYIPSIDILEVQQIDGEANWTTPVVSYLKEGLLPENKEEAQKLKIRAAKFVLMDKVLYKRSFSQSYLRCLTPDESYYIIRDIHEGACWNHSGARSFVHKIVRAGYYWPTMQADTKAYVKAFEKCQHFSNIPRCPSEYLTPMIAHWPFA